ncbi:hypothetical protein Ddye_021437 [Dipteronia dyeriana]|uniref:Uncharacterized protein n=1 Tax=Dipteronia dyeriana TaxID=168575 RepID=A0AAD9U284_9ROSI|nr:hypothetical protein Ddye_021437 [Dipteronia dyeriana]
MGLEISEEFRPISPIRMASVPTSYNFKSRLSDREEIELPYNYLCDGVGDGDDHDKCYTPKSAAHTLNQPLLCPQAPKKSRPSMKNRGLPPQGFFQVQDDLASIFLVLQHKPSKKIRAN